jgi:hypothetical protein
LFLDLNLSATQYELENLKSINFREPDVTADVFGGTTDGQKLIAESTKIFWDVISQGSAEREERRQKKAGEEAPVFFVRALETF